jgi:hypothetical protein
MEMTTLRGTARKMKMIGFLLKKIKFPVLFIFKKLNWKESIFIVLKFDEQGILSCP